jgi:transcriptional regulator with XRE-family HTH domain
VSLTIGQKISKLIDQAGYASLGQLYRDSAVSVATLSRIVNDIQKPTPATLKKLAPCLSIPYEELLSIAGYLDDHLADHKVSESQIRYQIPKSQHLIDVIARASKLSEETQDEVADHLEVLLRYHQEKIKKKRGS